jgi:glycosyltransferase involved in cell wall biosynthesis
VRRASVIVRCKDEEKLIERTFQSLRRQTVEPEIIVVDSGSRDRSVEIARRWCDELIEIPAESFTFGYSLNVGARAASAPFHFALSAHCHADRDDWIERTLTHYELTDVAGVYGYHAYPDGTPITGVFHQDAAHARAHPFWGFSNHASSWRASVWKEFPFDEKLPAAEDREWAQRVLDAGWVIAFDPELTVDMSHAWRSPAENFRRQRLCAHALAGIADLPEYGLGDLRREWWSVLPDDRHSPWLYRIDPRRLAGLAGKYLGRRDHARSAARG